MSRFKTEKWCAVVVSGMAHEWRKRVRHRTSVILTEDIGNGAKARHRPSADATGDFPYVLRQEITCGSTARLLKTKKEKEKEEGDNWIQLGAVVQKIVEQLR